MDEQKDEPFAGAAPQREAGGAADEARAADGGRTTRADAGATAESEDVAVAVGECPGEGVAVSEEDGRGKQPDDRPVAERIATRLCEGFQAHDERDREAAIEAFAAVDTFQFAHLDESEAREAARAYVDALWAKDALEVACRVGADDGDDDLGGEGALDRSLLADVDWHPVEAALAERAAIVGIDPAYAERTTEGWRRHKVGGDYWTPHLRAQQLELQAALDDREYPHKPRHGRSGAGPEATRYLLGVELHDTRQWAQARDAMVPYFERIAAAHGATA